MKRYAIVRVDGTTFCPSTVEGKDIDDFVCSDKNCKNCRYGDTKRQLVRKVTQALVRARIEEDENSKSLSWEQIATKIVEFLGVME